MGSQAALTEDCAAHPGRGAVFYCSRCHRPGCSLCRRPAGGKVFCGPCALDEKRSRALRTNDRLKPSSDRRPGIDLSVWVRRTAFLVLALIALDQAHRRGWLEASASAATSAAETVSSAAASAGPGAMMEGRNMGTIVDLIEMYLVSNGRVPGDLPAFLNENLETHGHAPSVDAWGTPYRLESEGTEFTLISAGPDRSFGTGDDISMEGGY